MKRHLTWLVRATGIIDILYLAFPHPAYAYLDPGTGSFILQMLIATLLGILLAVRLFWAKIKIFLGNLFSRGRSKI